MLARPLIADMVRFNLAEISPKDTPASMRDLSRASSSGVHARFLVISLPSAPFQQIENAYCSHGKQRDKGKTQCF